MNFTFKPADFLSDADGYLKVASELFTNAGWYGDGEIQPIWVPPFMVDEFTMDEDAFGVVIWQIKQKEDGISWLLSPKELPLNK